uniref:NADH-ubiquinone oxidoreductase chain 6 n=1 Tax=Shinkaia crosnieri TaxID=480484 RepID=B3TZD4_SHICR|nr:NADH dehydrogenase subunit 6 [Shinkaia crosnieri]
MLPIIMIISLLFLSMIHPLSAGLILLIQTIMVTIAAGLTCPTFWFSYILFLIFLGGMLVLFIYVASVASNEHFQFNFKLFLFVFYISFSIFMLIIFIDPILISNKILFPTSSMNYEINMSASMKEISPIYSTSSYSFTLFIISYLLLTLIVIVKIMNTSSSPLRLSN